MKELPIGVIDFKDLINGNFTYVDKTKYIYELVKRAKGYYFLSRPRRFGKSLTVSVLEYLFKGEKKLFEGTWIYDKWNWESFPVVRLDMNEIDTTSPEDTYNSLFLRLKRIAKDYDVSCVDGTISDVFYYLVQDIGRKYNKPVVLLIDEYEKPILDHISDKQKAHEMREILRQLYTKIKSLDQYLRFVFLTGITKYTKAGVFCTSNNLVDISFHEDFSQMLGYTQEEIIQYFPEYIDMACQKLNMSKDYLLEQLEKYYGGFSFDGKHFVFNPFAVLLFFFHKSFLVYWNDSGAPKFLHDYLRARKVKLEDILKKDLLISYIELTSREIEESVAKSFLVQAGYLTFYKEIDSGLYGLKIPNIDAGQSLSQMLLELNYELDIDDLNRIGVKIKDAVKKENVDGLIGGLKEILGKMSYRLSEKIKQVTKNEEQEDKLRTIESHYEMVISGILFGSGVYHEIEKEVSGGIIDILIENNGVAYIIELKVDKSAKEALEQIKERRYYEGFTSKKCYLIGVSIDSRLKNIKEWTYEVIEAK
ncbi:MAG: AAA family ATPase [Fervidobacterium sp.]|uniref:ATP-binding protein n=1 Tax=Fervidobacterium sp. TaxID=1871331 RepID=UPI0025C0E1A6|nr:ATP-binding protein [Fervidobacterium sp.]NPU90019.1 AAA family ATPase [Fervidobacterium sp.]